MPNAVVYLVSTVCPSNHTECAVCYSSRLIHTIVRENRVRVLEQRDRTIWNGVIADNIQGYEKGNEKKKQTTESRVEYFRQEIITST